MDLNWAIGVMFGTIIGNFIWDWYKNKRDKYSYKWTCPKKDAYIYASHEWMVENYRREHLHKYPEHSQ